MSPLGVCHADRAKHHGDGESPDGFSPLHDVLMPPVLVLAVGVLGCTARALPGPGLWSRWGWRTDPTAAFATEDVEVDGTPRVDHAGTAVLSHGLAVRAQHPRVGLVAGRLMFAYCAIHKP